MIKDKDENRAIPTNKLAGLHNKYEYLYRVQKYKKPNVASSWERHNERQMTSQQ